MAGGGAIFLVLVFSAILSRVLGTMDVCSSGSYGPNCTLTCGLNCVGSRCRSHQQIGTFVCTDGCSDGWWGSMCDRKCHRGCRSCDQFTERCEECLEGRCGQDCVDICSTQGPPVGNCRDSSCQRCLDGWCNRKCPSNCISGCDVTSGQCDHECVRGYHGSTCNRQCTTNCKEGCAQEDGSCIGGCAKGWHGIFCNRSCGKTCLDAVCYQTSGECSRGSQGIGFSNCKVVTVSGKVYRDCTAGCQSGWRGERCDQKCPDECYLCPQYPDGRRCYFAVKLG